MKLLLTGICGFVGSSLARELKERFDNLDLLGMDTAAVGWVLRVAGAV